MQTAKDKLVLTAIVLFLIGLPVIMFVVKLGAAILFAGCILMIMRDVIPEDPVESYTEDE